MEQHSTQYIWLCSWNWCPEKFHQKADLLTHVHGAHFNNILKVKKRDWDAYVRSTEGRNEARENLLDVDLAYPSTSSTESADHDDDSASSASRQRSPPPATPPPRYPPLPRNVRTSRSQSNASSHTPPLTNPSPMLPPASPASVQRGPSPAKRRRTSFASCNAQSSPMSTPSVSSVPASPALSSMIADAINRAGQLNQRSPHNPHSAAGRFAAAGMQGPPHVLPRRTSMGASPSPLSQGSRPMQTIPHPPSPTRPRANSKLSNSSVSASVGSAEAVEDALTQNISPKSLSPSRPGSGVANANRGHPASQASTQTPISSPQKSSQSSDMQHLSHCGSHAVESNLVFPDSYQTYDEAHAESKTLPTQPSASPPLPLTRRARSRASADTQPSQPPVPAPTRTLRSRSKTPAPAPPPPPPPKISLPRRTNRTRGGSSASNTNSNTSSQPRAGSKPPSTRRAGSKQPPPLPQSGTAHAPGLPALEEEKPDEGHHAAADASDATVLQHQHQHQPAFRSGKLQLPRRTRTAPNAQSQSQTQSQMARSQSDVHVSVKTEPEDADTMNVDLASQTAPSQSQDSGGYREGYGFDLRGIQLMTQKPYPSQSQDWS
ncbi:hypothetical protein L226DRAFT_615109 [Lentinus tigrinus ALCF2SS1-7]|uniref:C2H2-type domain-containing protein n=1 Tax=Lentinus tigrinus ALCF2SS1-6 TaxID=1328759 RepID=A0A5C2S1Z6_9APHY|nr:hypothetical protein L227DRAFT_655578 [Lentinus tigrinus ALCF2SS1-6]RPD72124.1 hypothetical protein L226DRAFT_615109 [Lentinus tigrinus ALCF2SS1-7]